MSVHKNFDLATADASKIKRIINLTYGSDFSAPSGCKSSKSEHGRVFWITEYQHGGSIRIEVDIHDDEGLWAIIHNNLWTLTNKLMEHTVSDKMCLDEITDKYKPRLYHISKLFKCFHSIVTTLQSISSAEDADAVARIAECEKFMQRANEAFLRRHKLEQLDQLINEMKAKLVMI